MDHDRGGWISTRQGEIGYSISYHHLSPVDRGCDSGGISTSSHLPDRRLPTLKRRVISHRLPDASPLPVALCAALPARRRLQHVLLALRVERARRPRVHAGRVPPLLPPAPLVGLPVANTIRARPGGGGGVVVPAVAVAVAARPGGGGLVGGAQGGRGGQSPGRSTRRLWGGERDFGAAVVRDGGGGQRCCWTLALIV